MTSVSGHLISHDFEQRYKKWNSCDPSALFEARIESFVENGRKGIAKNIETQARAAQYLFIWTDCDREGENIGTEIRDIACKTNPRLMDAGKTVRARFSNIERAHIMNAALHPIALDEGLDTSLSVYLFNSIPPSLSFYSLATLFKWQGVSPMV